ncbi:hypothetical protein AHMF7605_11400 [Adhaeribacter arboris]|uniref:DUF4595 domain-containing protein n=1 Tax=Adhaeribacter arboris TaxID=2072846 RepID=A0A2T2YF21_9BACT|nr:hypothetical protein [Adhaeribacter arboris]PSR54083.1 hypothetical protein AHMF7605_11400 [Adhaeribacter arboris]
MYKAFLLALSFPLLLISCKKEGNEVAPIPVTPPVAAPVTCTLQRSNGDNGTIEVYEYDVNNRIKAVKRHVPAFSNSPARDFTYTFYRDSNNRIVEIIGGNDAAPEFQQKETYEYDDQGRWIKNTVTNVPDDKYLKVTVPEYDAQSLMVKATETRKNGYNTYVRERTYEYKNGNVISIRTKEGDRITTSLYEYYPDQENLLSEYERQTYYTFGLGSPPKNKMKSYKHIDNTYVTEGTYSYIFTGPGYVQQQTLTASANGSKTSSTFTNTYKCD